ncbi:RNA polymerase sigma factor [Bacillus sp. CGMCC 1.16607]|uniref:RNA polymerase sigma factor n=1 Tax=Bacillus sp. CGMCC 1.16607 TaxID=3351842 RepID=UPI00362E19A9
MYSRSIDIYRKNKRHIHNDVDRENEVHMKLINQSAQQLVIQKENKQEMLNEILKLKRKLSLPLSLHYYEDMSVADISLIIGENLNTVKTRMKRGKQMLAEIMNESTTFIQEVKTYGN